MTHVALAVTTARDTLTHSLAADPGAVSIESLTIAADALPHHFIARAVIFDLAPDQMVPAIVATEDAIRTQYPHFRRTGWRGASDGLRLYFTAWTAR